MLKAWLICGLGTLFCITGLYLFHKYAYEENRSLRWAVIIMIIGVILIAIGTKIYVSRS
jgi:uncharacterized membrane protein YczE